MNDSAAHRFGRIKILFYGGMAVLLCFIYVSIRWHRFHVPEVTKVVKKHHEDIEGKCIVTVITTTSITASKTFPLVSTIEKCDTTVWTIKRPNEFVHVYYLVNDLFNEDY